MPHSPLQSPNATLRSRILRTLLRALPTGALARMADQLLTAAHTRSTRSSTPHPAVLQTCATELLRTASGLSHRRLVRALLAGADNFPLCIQVRALEALAVATRDSAFLRRLAIFTDAAPRLARVRFEVNAELPVSDRHASRITRYVLFNTRGEQLAIRDDDLKELITRPQDSHMRLIVELRALSGSALPNLDAVETWIDSLCGLCFALHDKSGDTELILRELI